MHAKTRFNVDSNLRYILVYLGLNERDVLKHAGLPIDLFNRQNATLSGTQFSGFWNSIAELDDNPMPLALRAVALPGFGQMNAPIMAALCSPNFQVFVERLQQYKPLIGPIRLHLDATEQYFSVEIDCIDENVPLHPTIISAELLFFVSMLRHATGKQLRPEWVETSTPLEHPGYADYFQCPIDLIDKNRLVFSLADSLSPFKLRNDQAWQFFEPELNQRLGELEQDTSSAAAVRGILMESLPLGHSAIEHVAKQLHISPRTLQRRLKDEHTTYQAQLNHSRELLAKHYLKNSDMSITEIAFLVGYHEVSSFSRSFTLWTGESAESFRHKSPQLNNTPAT